MKPGRKQELQQEKAELKGEAAAILDTVEREERDLTDSERDRFDAIVGTAQDDGSRSGGRLREVEGDLARMELRADLKAATIERGVEVEDLGRTPEEPDPQLLSGMDPDRIASMIPKEARFESLGHQLQAIQRSAVGLSHDRRLDYMGAAQGASEASPAEGGFLLQPQYVAGILQRMHDTGQILSRVQRIPVGAGANGIRLRAVDETSRATGSRWGGVHGFWVDEGGALTASNPKFRTLSMDLVKLAALGYATDELLEDAAALDAIMTQGFAEELTFLYENAILNGNGAGSPLGILNSGATVSIAKEAGQAAATIVTENVRKMWSRAWARSRANMAWFINQDCEPELENMIQKVGDGGVAVYLPPGGLADAPLGRLRARPVIPTEYNPTLGTVGDILLLDLSQYLVIEKGGIRQATSMHVRFTTDEMAFRATLRVNGQPIWDAPLTPFQGTNTQSPFLSLATRS